MSDDFEFVRSLWPPTGDPTLEVVANERERLMNFIATQDSRSKRRRAATIATTVVVSTLGLVGVAAAVGILPGGVANRFSALEERDGSIEIDADNAVMVSSAADGSDVIELWVAPADEGQWECVYVRSRWHRSDGETMAEDGPVGCETSLLPWQDPRFQVDEPADYLSALDVFAVGALEDGFGSTAVTGAVHPDVTKILLDMQDGRQLTVHTITLDGWFTVLIPGDVTATDSLGVPNNPVRHVTLLDVNDNVLAELDDWPRYRAYPVLD